MKHRLFFRLVSLGLIQTFVIQQFAFAAPDIQPVKIDLFASEKPEFHSTFPQSVADIESSYKAEGAQKTLILFQDAHTNESGQFNLSKALDIVLEKEGVKYVFLEAAFGDSSLPSFKQYGTPEVRGKAAIPFVKQGLMHGDEYLYLSTNKDFTLWGVENFDLYKKAVGIYGEVAKNRGKYQDYLKRIKQTADTLNPRILNPLLQTFNQKHEAYEKGELSITEYFKVLFEQAKYQNIPLKDYPNLKLLNTLSHKESRIDFKKANEEQARAIGSLSAEDQKEMLSLAQEKESPFKLSGSDRQDKKAFYALLEEKLTQSNAYPELSKYFQYLKLAKKIEAKGVLKEIHALENEVFERLCMNEDESTFIHCLKNLSYLHKLFDLSLTPEEFEAYKSSSKTFGIAELTGFLNKKIMDMDTYYERTLFLEPGYEEIVKQSEEFYYLTYQRDIHFVNEALKKMDAEGQSRAALITGGYHTPNLKALLKVKGVSYIVVTPQVLKETNKKRYEKILLSQDLKFAPPVTNLNKTSTIATGRFVTFRTDAARYLAQLAANPILSSGGRRQTPVIDESEEKNEDSKDDDGMDRLERVIDDHNDDGFIDEVISYLSPDRGARAATQALVYYWRPAAGSDRRLTTQRVLIPSDQATDPTKALAYIQNHHDRGAFSIREIKAGSRAAGIQRMALYFILALVAGSTIYKPTRWTLFEILSGIPGAYQTAQSKIQLDEEKAIREKRAQTQAYQKKAAQTLVTIIHRISEIDGALKISDEAAVTQIRSGLAHWGPLFNPYDFHRSYEEGVESLMPLAEGFGHGPFNQDNFQGILFAQGGSPGREYVLPVIFGKTQSGQPIHISFPFVGGWGESHRPILHTGSFSDPSIRDTRIYLSTSDLATIAAGGSRAAILSEEERGGSGEGNPNLSLASSLSILTSDAAKRHLLGSRTAEQLPEDLIGEKKGARVGFSKVLVAGAILLMSLASPSFGKGTLLNKNPSASQSITLTKEQEKELRLVFISAAAPIAYKGLFSPDKIVEGEQALLMMFNELPVSVLRKAIIEEFTRHPSEQSGSIIKFVSQLKHNIANEALRNHLGPILDSVLDMLKHAPKETPGVQKENTQGFLYGEGIFSTKNTVGYYDQANNLVYLITTGQSTKALGSRAAEVPVAVIVLLASVPVGIAISLALSFLRFVLGFESSMTQLELNELRQLRDLEKKLAGSRAAVYRSAIERKQAARRWRDMGAAGRETQQRRWRDIGIAQREQLGDVKYLPTPESGPRKKSDRGSRAALRQYQVGRSYYRVEPANAAYVLPDFLQGDDSVLSVLDKRLIDLYQSGIYNFSLIADLFRNIPDELLDQVKPYLGLKELIESGRVPVPESLKDKLIGSGRAQGLARISIAKLANIIFGHPREERTVLEREALIDLVAKTKVANIGSRAATPPLQVSWQHFRRITPQQFLQRSREFLRKNSIVSGRYHLGHGFTATIQYGANSTLYLAAIPVRTLTGENYLVSVERQTSSKDERLYLSVRNLHETDKYGLPKIVEERGMILPVERQWIMDENGAERVAAIMAYHLTPQAGKDVTAAIRKGFEALQIPRRQSRGSRAAFIPYSFDIVYKNGLAQHVDVLAEKLAQTRDEAVSFPIFVHFPNGKLVELHSSTDGNSFGASVISALEQEQQFVDRVYFISDTDTVVNTNEIHVFTENPARELQTLISEEARLVIINRDTKEDVTLHEFFTRQLNIFLQEGDRIRIIYKENVAKQPKEAVFIKGTTSQTSNGRFVSVLLEEQEEALSSDSIARIELLPSAGSRTAGIEEAFAFLAGKEWGNGGVTVEVQELERASVEEVKMIVYVRTVTDGGNGPQQFFLTADPNDTVSILTAFRQFLVETKIEISPEQKELLDKRIAGIKFITAAPGGSFQIAEGIHVFVESADPTKYLDTVVIVSVDPKSQPEWIRTAAPARKILVQGETLIVDGWASYRVKFVSAKKGPNFSRRNKQDVRVFFEVEVIAPETSMAKAFADEGLTVAQIRSRGQDLSGFGYARLSLSGRSEETFQKILHRYGVDLSGRAVVSGVEEGGLPSTQEENAKAFGQFLLKVAESMENTGSRAASATVKFGVLQEARQTGRLEVSVDDGQMLLQFSDITLFSFVAKDEGDQARYVRRPIVDESDVIPAFDDLVARGYQLSRDSNIFISFEVAGSRAASGNLDQRIAELFGPNNGLTVDSLRTALPNRKKELTPAELAQLEHLTVALVRLRAERGEFAVTYDKTFRFQLEIDKEGEIITEARLVDTDNGNRTIVSVKSPLTSGLEDKADHAEQTAAGLWTLKNISDKSARMALRDQLEEGLGHVISLKSFAGVVDDNAFKAQLKVLFADIRKIQRERGKDRFVLIDKNELSENQLQILEAAFSEFGTGLNIMDDISKVDGLMLMRYLDTARTTIVETDNRSLVMPVSGLEGDALLDWYGVMRLAANLSVPFATQFKGGVIDYNAVHARDVSGPGFDYFNSRTDEALTDAVELKEMMAGQRSIEFLRKHGFNMPLAVKIPVNVLVQGARLVQLSVGVAA